MTVQADINRQDQFQSDLSANTILDDTAPTRVACQETARGEQQIYKTAQFWAEKLGTGRVLSNKFGTGSAPEKGVWNEIIEIRTGGRHQPQCR